MPVPLASGATIQVGSHTVTREGPITRVATVGTISREQIERFLEEYQGMIDEQGFALIMMDVRNGGDMAMPTRRFTTEWGSKRGHCVRAAVFGASFFLRTAIELINRAAASMTGNAPKVNFVRTAEEARAWLLEQIPLLPQKNSVNAPLPTSNP